ncbi:hypothetical protein [Paraburkholderia hospita]|uniref:hypothetical protein n=1 Tax=Paraburkholderia hospita TaxID=169430 RepID=UPI001177B74A|nr:hypothetical protein [Paraburkholderia hospita]
MPRKNGNAAVQFVQNTVRRNSAHPVGLPCCTANTSESQNLEQPLLYKAKAIALPRGPGGCNLEDMEGSCVCRF